MPGDKTKARAVPKFVEDPPNRLLSAILSPSGVGALTGALLTAAPTDSLVTPGMLTAALRIPGLSESTKQRVVGTLCGFVLGYAATKTLGWAREISMRSLYTYTGWIYNPRSRKTKVWAILLKLLRGPGPQSTLGYQSLLPKQPLPDLDETLDRWLAVLEPLLSPAELAQTREAVEHFRQHEGPQLQQYLLKRARDKPNWLSEYWLTAAYLTGRAPTAVNSNFYVCNHIPKDVSNDPLDRAAQVAYYSCLMEYHISKGRLSPANLQDLVPLCMSGTRFLFNSCRLPGEYMDVLVKEPGNNRYIVVIRKGQYYKMDVYASDGNDERMLTQQEMRDQLAKIRADADVRKRPLPVAALTSQNRTLWWKQRQELALKNKETLQAVEAALFILVLDEHNPKDKDEHASRNLTGDGSDRWFDKSFNTIIFEDASEGANVEHSVIDATVMGQLFEYCMYNEEYIDGKLVPDPKHKPRQLDMPKRLTWDVSGMEEKIQTAITSFNQLAGNLDMKVLCTSYGREFMKKCRISPDAYVQMSLQLAYYRLHKEIVKTYEPSTGRLFLLGRTETVHPVSASSVAWVKAMDDKTVSKDDTIKLLKDASKYQTSFRLDATVGHGCDRHLLGLYCASRELGMDIPAIFRDKGWQMPYKLSTSQTPTRFYEWGLKLDVDRCGGGFAPSVEDGYGIAYFHVGDDQINIHISTWNSCQSTSSSGFVTALDNAFQDMKTLFAK